MILVKDSSSDLVRASALYALSETMRVLRAFFLVLECHAFSACEMFDVIGLAGHDGLMLPAHSNHRAQFSSAYNIARALQYSCSLDSIPPSREGRNHAISRSSG